MSTYRERLAEMRKNWKENSEVEFGSVDPGTYLARVQDVELCENSKGGLQIKVKYLIYDSEAAGQVLTDWKQLSGIGVGFVRRWVELVGFTWPDDPVELEDLCLEIAAAAPCVRLRVTKDPRSDFPRIRELAKVDEDEMPEAPDVFQQDADDDEGQNEVLDISEHADDNDDGRLVNRLLDFCQSFDLDYNDNMSADELVEVIAKYEFETDQLTSEEIELLESVGIEVQKPARKRPTKPAAKTKAKVDKDAQRLAQIAEEYGIEVPKGASAKQIARILNEYEWSAKAMDDEEVELFRAHGVDVQ